MSSFAHKKQFTSPLDGSVILLPANLSLANNSFIFIHSNS